MSKAIWGSCSSLGSCAGVARCGSVAFLGSAANSAVAGARQAHAAKIILDMAPMRIRSQRVERDQNTSRFGTGDVKNGRAESGKGAMRREVEEEGGSGRSTRAPLR